MRLNWTSQTAQFVCLFRAMADISPEVPSFSDPLAKYFLNWIWSVALTITGWLVNVFPGRSPFPFWLKRVGLRMQFRTVVLDKALKDSLPFEQLVILGAGLDSRAWRLKNELNNVKIFEVDHPTTQKWKIERVKVMKKKENYQEESEENARVHFVSVDFNKDKLENCLEKSGFSKRKKTFWIWEGVTMYLEEDNVRKTLKLISDLSSGGGTIALSYLDKLNGTPPMSFIVTLLGEPFMSAYSLEEMNDLGRSCGWETVKNEGDEDWNEEYRKGKPLPDRSLGSKIKERIWIGTKKGKTE
jgi:methyltransferase (TIGR00027 family)